MFHDENPTVSKMNLHLQKIVLAVMKLLRKANDELPELNIEIYPAFPFRENSAKWSAGDMAECSVGEDGKKVIWLFLESFLGYVVRSIDVRPPPGRKSCRFPLTVWTCIN